MSDDYEVGYGRPPKHTRFQPGQSGNPRGRRRGSRGLKTDLHAELASNLTIQINGKPVKATAQRLMLKTLAARAASGDIKAAGVLLPLILQVFGFEDRGGERQRLSPQDQALLEEIIAAGGAADDGQAATPGNDEGAPGEEPSDG